MKTALINTGLEMKIETLVDLLIDRVVFMYFSKNDDMRINTFITCTGTCKFSSIEGWVIQCT